MLEFLRGWKKKVGVVTLVVTCFVRHVKTFHYRVSDFIFNYPDIGRYDPQIEKSIWESRTTKWEYPEYEAVYTEWLLDGRLINEFDDSSRKMLMEDLKFSSVRLRDGDEIWKYESYGETGLAAFREGRLVEIIACWELYPL